MADDTDLEGRRVVLRNKYSEVGCTLLHRSSRTLEPTYTFAYWEDHETIRLIDVPVDSCKIRSQNESIEIVYANSFLRPAVISKNPAKATSGQNTFGTILRNFEAYSKILESARVKSTYAREENNHVYQT